MTRRGEDETVSPALADYIFERDRVCVIGVLGRIGAIPHQGPCRGRLTIAHVRDRRGGRMGKRPKSIPRRLAAVCEGHHTLDPIVDRKEIRPVVDEYLERIEGPERDAGRPWERIRRVRAGVDSTPEKGGPDGTR